MREIKFRAWNKKERKMHYNPLLVVNFSGKILSPANDIHCGYLECPDLELMQFTGLKDKNGNEIYEGDIVFYEGIQSLNEEDITSPIEWGKWCYVISNHKAFDIISARSFELIGNIYENPELLKELLNQEVTT